MPQRQLKNLVAIQRGKLGNGALITLPEVLDESGFFRIVHLLE